MTRQAIIAAIRQRPEVTVLVVGGGINGIGTFRDLALQGIDVLLVDKGDFGSGTSAASSHMAHGGIRYLENGEFRLVREALTERNRMLQNAPHYVKPLPTTIPMFHWFSGLLNAPLKFVRLRDKPSSRGVVVIKVGLMLYDLFTRGQQTLPKHRFTSRQKALEQRPALNPDIITTATYYDGFMPYPERYCLELIQDAMNDSPDAKALNYAAVVGGSGDTVTIRDELSGEEFTVKPQVVVNAAGPWIDLANRAMQRETRFIGGTKGSHLVIDHPELREVLGDSEFFFENEDGRICLILPMLERVMLGTTDIRVDDPDDSICSEEEIDYILKLVKHVFPPIEIDRSHIVFHFSGVRPLPASDATTTGQISRDHSIRALEPGDGVDYPILSLVGGKWTTYRAFSEQVTDAVLSRLGRERKASTQELPIGGGRDFPLTEAERERWLGENTVRTGIDRGRLASLLDRYGTQALEIAAFMAAGDDAPLASHPDYTRRELIYLAENEHIVHLDDLLLRRTLLAMLGYVNAELLREVAEILAAPLGWSEEVTRQEISRCAELLRERHGVQLEVETP